MTDPDKPRGDDGAAGTSTPRPQWEDNPLLGGGTIVNPYAPLERRFAEECQNAGITALTAQGDPPAGLRNTIFGIAWKSGIGDYGGPHGGEFPIRIGLERGEEDRMVVTQINISYRRLQGDIYQWRLLVRRRSVPVIVERDGKTFREMMDGLATEANYRVQEVSIEQGLGEIKSRAARYALGEISDRTTPESIVDAMKAVETYRITLFREDRQEHRAVYHKKETPILEGLVRTMLTMRAVPMMDEPMECPGIYPAGYLGGSMQEAVRRAFWEEFPDARR
jgi:hypothetical protein